MYMYIYTTCYRYYSKFLGLFTKIECLTKSKKSPVSLKISANIDRQPPNLKALSISTESKVILKLLVTFWNSR